MLSPWSAEDVAIVLESMLVRPTGASPDLAMMAGVCYSVSDLLVEYLLLQAYGGDESVARSTKFSKSSES